MNNNCVRNVIEPKQIIEINNDFRAIGLSRRLSGTKFLKKAVQLILATGDEFFVLEDILDEIIISYPDFNKMQIRVAMKYALDHREINEITKKNFEEIFKFEDNEQYETTYFLEEYIYAISNN